jgi:cell division protein FtsW
MTATAAALGTLRRRWVAAGATRPANYVLLAATVGVLNVVGAVMVLSASSVASLTDYGSAWYFFQRQAAWTAVGVAAFIITARIDYHAWRRWVRPLLVISGVLLVAVLIPGIGVEVAGSRRWLGTRLLRVQPTEIAKLALLVFAADVVSRRAKELHDWRRVLRPVLIVLALFGVLVLREPDLDSTVVLTLIAFTPRRARSSP